MFQFLDRNSVDLDAFHPKEEWAGWMFQFLDRNSVDLDRSAGDHRLVAQSVSIPRSEFCGFRPDEARIGFPVNNGFNSSIGILWI